MFCSVQCKNRATQSQRNRKHFLSKRYGLTGADVERMATGGCEICGTTEWGGRWNVPCVDHDHETGRVRGVLCSECNNGIGKLGDDPQRLRAAANYLERRSGI